MITRRPWQEELDIIDRTMKAISGVTDPEQMVSQYWEGIGDLIPFDDYVSLSRRGVDPPAYLITRSSRFTEYYNPWTQREKLPRLTGGILGEVAYANAPVFIDDLSTRLERDDPGYFYLQGFERLIAVPQYDNGEGLNVSAMLIPPGKKIDPAIIPMLHWQSSLFGRGTQNLVLRNQLSSAMAALERELKVVGEIQRSLLPDLPPLLESFDFAVDYKTSASAGGDYYDFFPLDNGQWGLFIADVSGHGTPAAVLMAITRALVHAQPHVHAPPAELLTQLNQQLTRSYTRQQMFVTAFYGILNPKNCTLTYSSAGHPPPRLVRGNEVLSLDGAREIPLGILEDDVSYQQATVQLTKRDLLLIYTDGITEAMCPATSTTPRELFGTDRLDELLLACPIGSAADTIECVRANVMSFSGKSVPADDQTLIAIRCA